MVVKCNISRCTRIAVVAVFALLCFAPKAHAAATPVLCASNGPQAVFSTGNVADCPTGLTLMFGKQGTSTASMAIPMSVNNCSNTDLTMCSGSGSLTLGSSPYAAITGTNAADFAITGGSCANGSVLTAGQSCTIAITFTPTQTAGTNESATLTVNFSGVASQTMALTGTSATVTTLSSSSCPTSLTASTNYQLTADITCAGSVFNGASSVDLNLNGHTITYGNSSNSTFIGGVLLGTSNIDFVMHNGSCNEGVGTNTGVLGNNSGPGCIVSTDVNSSTNHGLQMFNLNMSCHSTWCKMLFQETGSTTTSDGTQFHDNIYADNDSTQCTGVPCRENSQSFAVMMNDDQNESGVQFYGNYGIGGPQGTFSTQGQGAVLKYNVSNPGNVSATNTNGYALQDWGSAQVLEDNYVYGSGAGTSCTSCRGIQINNTARPVNGATVQNNFIRATGLNNDAEYPNCGGLSSRESYTMGIQANTAGATKTWTNVTIQNNKVKVVAAAGECGAIAFEWSAINQTGNVSQNNTYECDASGTLASSQTCTGFGSASKQYTSVDNAITFTNDTFLGDKEALYFFYEGSNSTEFSQCSFGQGTNPQSGWLFINFYTAASSGGSINPLTFIDPTFLAGTESSTNMAAWETTNPTLTAQYTIEFTQTVHVQNSGGSPIAGASVTYTDALSNAYPCTTDGSGNCKVIVNENQYSASGGTTTTTHYNNYARAVSATGFPTDNASGLVITAPNSVTVTLTGGTVPVIPAPSGLVASISDALMTCVETIQDVEYGGNWNIPVNDQCMNGEPICQCYAQ